MNAHKIEIIDRHIVHVAVAGTSARLEKMGLCTLLEKFQNTGVSIRSFTTGRHVQIRSYMAEEQKTTKGPR